MPAGGGSWTIGTDPTYPPFEMRGEGGSLEGFDGDLVRAIARRTGRSVRLVPLPFDGLIPALQAGTLDAAISAMTVAPERAGRVDFSRPCFKVALAVAVRDGEASIRSFQDLRGRAIGVQIGTVGATFATKIPGAQVVQFDAAPLALQELVNGSVDAVVNDLPACPPPRPLRRGGGGLRSDCRGLPGRDAPIRHPVDRARPVAGGRSPGHAPLDDLPAGGGVPGPAADPAPPWPMSSSA